MRLYQVTAKREGLRPFHTRLFTSKTLAGRNFSAEKKNRLTLEVSLLEVTVRTELRAREWLLLIQRDTVGSDEGMAPRDLVESEVLLQHWKRDRGREAR